MANREHPWDIIEQKTDGDGRRVYVRLDGVELRDAEDNLWYKMMTVADGIEGLSALERKVKNRRYWNGWACQELSDEARTKLAQTLGIEAEELAPLSEAERRFMTATISEELPSTHEIIELSETYFLRYLDANCLYFPGWAVFESSFFSGLANFSYATFSDWAFFSSATFSAGASFSSATFSDWADFSRATFSDWAEFSKAKFEGRTRFDDVEFKNFAPEFYGAEFHPDITLPANETQAKTHWPPVPKIEGDFDQKKEASDQINSQKNAYTELRRHMSALHKVEEEQFFYRREMACQEALEDRGLIKSAYKGFDRLADYGWSIKKPLLWLSGIWLAGWFLILLVLQLANTEEGFWSEFFFSAILSGASSLPAFGARRELIAQLKALLGDGATLAQFNAISFITMLQTGLGIFFLFLLILAIRNRFRLR